MCHCNLLKPNAKEREKKWPFKQKNLFNYAPKKIKRRENLVLAHIFGILFLSEGLLIERLAKL